MTPLVGDCRVFSAPGGHRGRHGEGRVRGGISREDGETRELEKGAKIRFMMTIGRTCLGMRYAK